MRPKIGTAEGKKKANSTEMNIIKVALKKERTENSRCS